MRYRPRFEYISEQDMPIELDIPDGAIAVNTEIVAGAPTLIGVTWLEPIR